MTPPSTSRSHTYLWIAETVLRAQARPMRVAEIVAVAQDLGLFTDEMYSRTPQKSMQARLSMDIVKNGSKSMFVRTGRGQFCLHEIIGSTETVTGDTLPLENTVKVKVFEAKPRGPRNTDESVLVVPQQKCRELFEFQGLERVDEEALNNLLRKNLQYLPRTDAERSSEFKQVITYTVITRGTRVLSFRRGRFNRAANFLRGSACIGFGGHVTDDDYSLFTLYDSGVRQNAVREIAEEIKIDGRRAIIDPDALEYVGIINDDSSDIGRRHFAVVFRIDVSGESYSSWSKPARGEMSINSMQWIDTISPNIDLIGFEYWSQLCWRELWPETAQALPSFQILRRKNFKNSHILTIAGGIGSGKSFATRYLKENYGYFEVNSGKVMAKLLNLPPVPETSRLDFQAVAWDFINSEKGPERLAEEILAEINNCDCDRIIVDGIRQKSTLQELIRYSAVPVAQLFIHATPDLAMQLYTSREGNSDISAIQFMDMINAKVEKDISLLMHDADAVIYNWLGELDYSVVLDSMAKDLKIARRPKYEK